MRNVNGAMLHASPIRATSPEDADAERTARQMEIEQLLGGLSVGLGGGSAGTQLGDNDFWYVVNAGKTVVWVRVCVCACA